MPDAAQNSQVIVFASSVQTPGARTSPTFINENAVGLELVIDITAVSGAGNLTATIQGLDDVSGQAFTVLASASLASVATTVLKIYPGLTAAANTVVSDHLPGRWRVSIAGTGTSITYSIAGWYLV